MCSRSRRAPAELGLAIDRDSLARVGDLDVVEWTPAARDAFIDVLAAGRGAIPVFEALDHVGVLVRLLPEWGHVRARPQRNAYHRFTVDRHSLEAVAESAAIRASDGLDGDIARRSRLDLMLLGALLHDIGKGNPRDHSEVGAETAVSVARRIGLDEHGTAVLVWLVRNHLLLADTATGRDLSDPVTITRFAAPPSATPNASTCSTCSRSATRARPGRRRGARARLRSCGSSS